MSGVCRICNARFGQTTISVEKTAPSFGGVKKRHIGTDAVIDRAGEARIGVQQLFRHQHVIVGMSSRGGDDLGVRQGSGVAVKLDTRCGIVCKPLVADARHP
jgi:hypothetical protein